MRIIARRTLRFIWESNQKHLVAKTALEDWHARTAAADWSTPADLKVDFGDASILKAGRVVFNIGGNKFRLVVQINYHYRIVYVRFVGTHQDYNRINAQTI
jgi:mRNA interferase HigB